MEFYILYLKSLTHSCPRDSLFWMCSFLKLAGSSATYGMEHLFMARTTSHTSVFSLKNKTKQQTFYGKWVNKSIFLQLDCSRPTRDSSLTFYFISNPDVYFTSASTFFFFFCFFVSLKLPHHSIQISLLFKRPTALELVLVLVLWKRMYMDIPKWCTGRT